MKFEEEITDDEAESIEQEAAEVKQQRRPKTPGLLLTIFGAIIVVLIGGLASYYYYTFQSQGMAGEKVLKRVWADTVDDTSALLNRVDAVGEFDKLADIGDQSVTKAINTTNQTVRDGLYDVRAQAGLGIKASTTASKLTSFLEDYSDMLAELKRVISRATDIGSIEELDALTSTGEIMEKSYDELLLVGNGVISEKLPRAIFDVPMQLQTLLTKKIDEGGTKSEQEQAAKQASEQIVSQFVQAWQNRDPDSMSSKLTTGAKGEFKPGIVEDSVEITGFRITSSTLSDDLGKATILGQLEKQTPDKKQMTENWEFIVLKQGDNWLIDRWQQKT